MHGYTFYLEHATPTDKRKGKNTGNCIAVGSETIAPINVRNAANTTKLRATDEVTPEHLEKNCTEITQEEAAIHHPNLFSFLGINI